jgi:hypothetical protein
VVSTFLRIGVPFFQQGNFSWGEKQVKKTLATILLMGMPTAALAMGPWQNGAQETAPSMTTSSSAAKSHHSSKGHKRSKNTHHKTQKHHAAKQHPQTQ